MSHRNGECTRHKKRIPINKIEWIVVWTIDPIPKQYQWSIHFWTLFRFRRRCTKYDYGGARTLVWSVEKTSASDFKMFSDNNTLFDFRTSAVNEIIFKSPSYWKSPYFVVYIYSIQKITGTLRLYRVQDFNESERDHSCILHTRWSIIRTPRVRGVWCTTWTPDIGADTHYP